MINVLIAISGTINENDVVSIQINAKVPGPSDSSKCSGMRRSIKTGVCMHSLLATVLTLFIKLTILPLMLFESCGLPKPASAFAVKPTTWC